MIFSAETVAAIRALRYSFDMKKTNLMRFRFVSLALLFLLSGCQSLAPTPPPPPVKTVADQRLELAALPGAVVAADGLSLSYPGEVLFGDGAVLPLPGGMKILLPLAEWMLQTPELIGTATVRAQAADAAYALKLATTRRELLEQLLQGRGISAERLQWQVEVGDGPPLEIHFQSPSGGSSSGGKS
jgi:hypothetical protein